MKNSTKPYPFKTILTALAYSPRMEANINEAARFCNLLAAKWILVHAGEKTVDKENKLNTILAKLPFIIIPQVIWEEGNPVDVVLENCGKYNVDLIIAGALQRENILKFYIGSISREICRKATCSVLLLTAPHSENNPLHKIVASAPANDDASSVIETAAYIAKNYSDCQLTITKEQRIHRLVNSLSEDSSENANHYKGKSILFEKEMLAADLQNCSNLEGLNYKSEVLEGKPGYATNYYARKNGADMLCVAGAEKQGTILDRIFTHDIEYILEDIPCTLLIVKSNH